MEIFEIFKDSLWSVKYEGDKRDVFSLRMLQWQDVEYLDSFFYSHRQFIDNNPFWKGYSFQEVLVSARKEAGKMLTSLSRLYWNSREKKHPDLNDRFVLLSREAINEEQKKRKMYGISDNLPSLFRLYAIKVESDKPWIPPAFVITGGGIKLVKDMSQMKELQHEYNRMQSVQNWLKRQGIETKEDLYQYSNERNG